MAPHTKKGAAGGDEQEQIPITSLSPQELVGVRDRVQGDVDAMTESGAQLQRLLAHFSASSRAIETLAESKEGAVRMCVCARDATARTCCRRALVWGVWARRGVDDVPAACVRVLTARPRAFNNQHKSTT